MYFGVIDHYVDNEIRIKPKNNEDVNECFVCYEVEKGYELRPLKLNEQNGYTKQCVCDGFIHQQCLDKWVRKTEKCPICRNEMYENLTLTNSIANDHKYGHIIFLFTVFNTYVGGFFRNCSFLFFPTLIVHFYLSVLDKSYFLDYHVTDGYQEEYMFNSTTNV